MKFSISTENNMEKCFTLMRHNLNQMLPSNVIEPETNAHSLMCCPPLDRYQYKFTENNYLESLKRMLE